VPDRVKGDAGVEFFTTDGVLYQCYAPEEVADVAKASSAMKSKGSRDLSKLRINSTVLEGILQHIRCRRWILLCPFLDDKDVVAFVRRITVTVHLMPMTNDLSVARGAVRVGSAR
jgi:hypothetical protein